MYEPRANTPAANGEPMTLKFDPALPANRTAAMARIARVRPAVYLREHHETWPWSEARWRWVDTAMAEVTQQHWWVDSASLSTALMGAASVRSVEEPHISRRLKPVAQLHRAPSLFPRVDRPCTSFSQWWTRASRGINTAEDLLAW